MTEKSYLEKGIQTPMAQGRSTKVISMIKWVRTSTLSLKKSLSPDQVVSTFVSTFQIDWPDEIVAFLESMQTFNFDLLSLPGPREVMKANRINVSVSGCSNFHVFGHVSARSAVSHVTNC